MAELRIYLMADFGKGIKRVQCSDPVLGGLRARCAKADARRWWLVEAESVQAARECIEYAQAGCNSADDGLPPGRILDSGGAA